MDEALPFFELVPGPLPKMRPLAEHHQPPSSRLSMKRVMQRYLELCLDWSSGF